mmetsp:Transcript_16859/g.23098  ORF Transcript_16859/g.23098 Transcript_16859/m.23098 type:complete len:228 (-) Transcript_16859:187-870(-)
MPAVMNLQVRSCVVMRNAAVKNPDEKPIDMIEKTSTPPLGNRYAFFLIEDITINTRAHCVAFTMNEHLMVSKETVPRAKTHKMVEQESAGLKAICTVALVHPVKEAGRGYETPCNPWYVDIISRVEKDVVANEFRCCDDCLVNFIKNYPTYRVFEVEGVEQKPPRSSGEENQSESRDCDEHKDQRTSGKLNLITDKVPRIRSLDCLRRSRVFQRLIRWNTVGCLRTR